VRQEHVPLPLSNIPPALVVALIAFAYLEQDGLLLRGGLLTALAVFAGAAIPCLGDVERDGLGA